MTGKLMQTTAFLHLKVKKKGNNLIAE